ncbi:MAG: HD domain-containing protein [Clostridia bacterium]|nr:HD domain-containing protein [Clostridia bacterium]
MFIKSRYSEKIRTTAALLVASVLFFASAFAAAPLRAENAKIDFTGRGIGYSTVIYDNANGLPTSDANSIVQTSEGFIWIGSYSGLIRYDGNEFYRYDSATGVSSVVSLFVDSKDRLWIGTNDSGVFMLKNGVFTSYDRNQGLRSSSIRSMEEDSAGNILIATTQGMAYIDTDLVMHYIDEPQINREYVCELVNDGKGTVYGVTLSGAFFTVNDLSLTAFYGGDSFGFGTINTVYPDPVNEGYIYLGTQNATVVHGRLEDHMSGAEVMRVDPQLNVRCIRYIDGLLWVCADNGIGFLSGDTYVALNSLPMNNSVEHMICDFEGNLWFTSSRQGIMKIVRNRFTDISAMADLPAMVVNTTFFKDGLLYIGTDRGLVLLDRNYSQVSNGITAMLSSARIRSIHSDSKDRLWFGTNSDYGLVCYDPVTGQIECYNHSNGLASNRARTMLEMSDGRIAVATNSGVNFIQNGVVSALYNGNQGISNLEILCLEEGPSGELYAGSDGDGIYVINKGKVSRIGRENGLRSEVILRMRRDSVDKELYWIITSNSIAYMKGDRVTSLNEFPYANNFDLCFDDFGRVWVLSSNGIYVVSREALLSGNKVDYILYDTSSGLPCAATANSYSYLEKSGTLYIAASTGVSSVDINDTTYESETIRLSVPYLTADNEYLFVENGQVKVPASCKRLVINAYAFSYSLNNPHLRVCLEGFDDAPIALTQHELSPLTYTNLPGGTYTFRISVIDTMTGLETETLTVRIIKEKSITEHIWFWVLLVVFVMVLAGAVVFLIARRKTIALAKKQKEHEKLIDEMTNVFANCIDMKDSYTNGHSHRVAKYTAMLAEKLGKSPEEVAKMHRIALLHDIGKISIPDSILNKPGKLTDEEYAVMKSHSSRGYEILKSISIAPELAEGAGCHHERQDGHGYPNGIEKESIPEVAQIIAVADTFDAMFSTRPYRKRMPLEDIVAELRRCSGTQLNEKVVNALLELIDEGAVSEEESEQK